MSHQNNSSGLALPDRVRLARELRGLTQREVVDDLEPRLSAPALSQIESGKIRPSAATLASLAQTLRVPIGFFSAQWPDDSREPTFFRNLRSTSVRERRRAAAQAALLGGFLVALTDYVRLPEIDIPRMALGAGATRSDLEEAAWGVRQAWDLRDQPIQHVVRSLERHGIVVARLSLGDTTVDAFSTWTANRPLVMLTDDKGDNYVRSRFDAAHELGHLVLHREDEPGTKEVEGQAHDFAASFLLPEPVAREELPRRLDASGWAKLAELKRTWGISMAALLYRARSLRVINQDAHRSAMRYMSSRGWRTQEPGDREMGAPESPLLLERSVRRAVLESGLSVDKLIEKASLPLEDVQHVLASAVDDRPIIEL